MVHYIEFIYVVHALMQSVFSVNNIRKNNIDNQLDATITVF